MSRKPKRKTGIQIFRDWPATGLAGICLVLVGCGSSEYSSSMRQNATEPLREEAKLATAVVGRDEAVAANQGPHDSSSAASISKSVRRHVIYTTALDLVVENYRKFESRLPEIVQKFGGFVASSDTDRRYNNRQSGCWVVRIPVTTYDDFLAGVDSLGFAESRRENAQDVTEEYIDVEARVANKRKLESRIVAMLEERSGKLSEVLDIERELARVREEIERMQGRLRFLEDRTALATVTIQCREQKAYMPPQAPTFLSRLTASWSSSLRSLRLLSENCALALTAAIPWIVIVGLPAWAMMRWLKRRRLIRRSRLCRVDSRSL